MMRKLRSIGLGGLAAVAAAWVLSAAPASAGPRQGDSEIQVSAGLFHAQGADSGNLNADLAYGYYLSPGWELGLRQAVNYNFIDDRRDFWLATTTPFLLYNFRLSDTVVPYLGASMGVVWNDRDATGAVAPNGGVKFFFHDQGFVNLGYRYDIFFDRIRAIDNNSSRGNHVVNVGLGFVWGGSRKP